MTKKFISLLSLVALSLATMTSMTGCSDDNDDNGEDRGNDGKISAYFFTGTNSEGSANYIATVESLAEGSSSIVGNGLETFTGTEWFTYKDKYLFRLQYNQGNNGGTSAYFLNSKGQIEQMPNTYDIQRFSTYGIYGNYVITSASVASSTKDAQGNAAYGISATYIDPIAGTTTNRDIIPAENYLGNGEYVTFSGITESKGKLYTAVIPMGLSAYGYADGNGKWVKTGNEDLLTANADDPSIKTLSATQYPDSCYVAVFTNEQMDNPTIIKTGNMSYACGRMRSQYYQCIWAADNGDVYVFSPNVSRTQADARLKSNHKSSVMRIKAGATSFDNGSGVVDIESLAGGLPLYRCWHLKDNYFLLLLYNNGINNMGTDATVMAVYDGDAKTVKIVSGLPDKSVISAFGKRPYNDGNGMSYITVQTSDGQKPAVYEINPSTATAKRGLEVECGEIKYAGRLIAQ